MSIYWIDASPGDQLLLKSIILLLKSRPDFKKLIFHDTHAKLRHSPKKILSSFAGMSHGEVVLIKLALDLWSGERGANLHEVIKILDAENWSNFLEALKMFTEPRSNALNYIEG